MLHSGLPSSLAFLLPSPQLPPLPSHIWSTVLSLSPCFCLTFSLAWDLPYDPPARLFLWPLIYLHVSQDCLAPLSTLSDTHTSTPRPQPCPNPSQTMSVLPQVKLSWTPPLETQECYRVSLTIWKDEADRARTLLPPSPLKPTSPLPVIASPSPAVHWVPVLPWMFRKS